MTPRLVFAFRLIPVADIFDKLSEQYFYAMHSQWLTYWVRTLVEGLFWRVFGRVLRAIVSSSKTCPRIQVVYAFLSTFENLGMIIIQW